MTKSKGARLVSCKDCRDWIVGIGRGRNPERCDLCKAAVIRQRDRERRPGNTTEPRRGTCADCGSETLSHPHKGKVATVCPPCRLVRARDANRRWGEANPADLRAAYRRANLKAHFGLTEDQLAAMISAQGGKCAICGTDEPGGVGRWHIDHDHACCPGKGSCGGCIRGLLCNGCNVGLGHLKDNPELMRRAADYIESYRR